MTETINSLHENRVASTCFSPTALALLALIVIVSPEAVAEHKRHEIKDTTAYIAMLEDLAREDWQRPSEVIEAINPSLGDAVADIGAGTGYFSTRFARAVGENGVVYAVDIDEKLLEYLKNRISEDKGPRLDNIKIVKAEHNDPLLAPASVDLVFICNTWHHIERRDEYLQLLYESLRPGGRLVMVDFAARETPFGPPLRERIPRDELVEECKQGKFSLYGEYHFLPYQYFLIFTRVE